mmetsp:Transcript_42188/g.77115  ORF Transcript_42188/g.77115 Transcript_42188/m.77115 type:complete len:352 (+) Transcript_42188:248-1303(+)|eukprot:CAMPEP_0201888478 /NCGR_PEP_ID=MMETSP0902-20130614/27706_1 /ASSEMBLY_ACC=CAM_ASM_000551 /TAXON_ID=420261 /ORGANISM="Thalassiosira antarctica, Strain CCMP982" /LENGTH=351 /DNA_ID=CAMNT_0048418743 /DNA_START=156 /DNA_END=1211 /DNA_ORIENTATION=+
MTVTSNDDPEIVLGGDPAPSAPPLSFRVPSAPPAMAMPTAVATPVSTAPPPSTATNSSGANIERSTNSDGSLSVKITTTTPQPNGYREVKIEYFTIPANMASNVTMALDAGESPSNLYMTKMEQQVLPPGTGAVMSRPPTHPTTATVQPSTPGPSQYTANTQVHESSGSDGRRACAICCGVVCLLVIIGAIVGGAEESSHSSNSYSPPSTPSWPSPPSYPFPSPTPPWSSPLYPTRSGAPTYWFQKKITPWPTKSPTISPRPTTSPRPTSPPQTLPPYIPWNPSTRSPAFPPYYPPSTRKKDNPAKSDSLDGSGNPGNGNGNTFKGEDESERDNDIMPFHKGVRGDIKEKE